jgi:hypothetical protein
VTETPQHPAPVPSPTPEPAPAPAEEPGLGQVTPRLVDLLRRTVPWMRAASAAGIVWVLFAAVLLARVVAPQSGRRLFAATPAVRVFWGLAASVLFAVVAAVLLGRFAAALERLAERGRNRTAALESALGSLRAFWTWAGAVTAVLLILRLALLVWGGAPPERPAGKPEQETAGKSRAPKMDPFFGNLRLVQVPASSREPLWTPPPAEPSLPGKALRFADLAQDCAIDAPAFLCVLNRNGEEIDGGSRWVVRQGVHLTLDESGVGDKKRKIADLSAPGWDVRVAPPLGFPFARTVFADTTLDPELPSRPVLAVGLTGCRETTAGGHFRIVEAELDPFGEPTRLVVDFETLCESGWPIIARIAAVKDAP